MAYQLSSEQQGHNHQNMACPSNYMQPAWNAGFNANMHVPTSPYNPSTPSFQPNGMDMQRYQDPRTFPAPDMQQMQKYIVDMNVSYLSDNARLDKMARGTAKEVEVLRNTLQRDLRILEGRIKSLQEDDADTDDAVVDGEIHKALGTISGLDNILEGVDEDKLLERNLSPTQEMLAEFSPHLIAREYLSRADIMEQVVAKLRWHAKKINCAVDHNIAPAEKLLEAPPTPGSKLIGFACCETAYGDVHELTAHVNEVHPDAVKPRLASDAGSQDTPTHIPAPRPRSSRSRAVEIKAPAKNAPTEGKRMINDLYNKTRAREAQAKAAESVQLPPQFSANVSVPVPAQPPTKWVPFAVRQMPERSAEIPHDTVTFSFDFLRDYFGGEEWSSGFYYNRKAGPDKEGKAYWLLDYKHEPYLPEAPGKHGAKLTAFFNETITKPGYAPYTSHYQDCPVFIKDKDSNEYRYFGDYSQGRYSDKVDYDHLMTQVPEHVRCYWAKELSSPGRPPWVTEKLMDQFWRRPIYDGPTPTDSAIQTPATFATETSAGGVERRVTKALNVFAEDLKKWEKDARLKVNLLSEDNIYESFAKSDLDAEPGMRLWWEYFEFQQFDTERNNTLTKMSRNPKLTKASGKSGTKRPATPPIRDTRDTEMKAGALDEKEQRKLGAYMATRQVTPPVRDTHQTALKAETIDSSDVQVVKPAPKTGDDVAAAVAKLQKEAQKEANTKRYANKKQPAVDSKARKAAVDQKQRDAARAPTQPSYPKFDDDAPRASAVPRESLSKLNTWLLDEDKKPVAAKSELKKGKEPVKEDDKPLPTWGGGGDLTVAKRLNEELKKAGSERGLGKGNVPKQGKGVPPHMRGK